MNMIAVAIVVAIACGLPGVFLVLRGMTMLSDAITHSVLLGIVLGFFVTQDLSSPWLFLGAAAIGVATVWLTETLQRTRLMKKDAAIGLVYPLFFSIAIILITRYAGSVHLALFYKELQVTTFHPEYAAALGFSPVLVHYGLMTIVSLTAVGAYDSVGSILVVGFMVGPALTAHLYSKKLPTMIGLTVLVAIFNSVVGVLLAFQFDVAIAGMIAVITGITTLLAFMGTLFQKKINKRLPA